MTDFSRIFAPRRAPSARTYGDVSAVHASRHAGNLHSFHHLDAFERSVATDENALNVAISSSRGGRR